MKDPLLSKDWAQTPLGPHDRWPHSLRMAFNMCRRSKSPTCIFWGPDLILIYNEPWKDLSGNFSHLGKPARQVLTDKQLVKDLQQVLISGEALKIRNKALPFSDSSRGNFHFTYNPIAGNTGEGQEGIFAIVNESSDSLQQRLKLAIEAGEIGIWDWDLETNKITWSDNLERIHGIKPGEFDGELESFLEVVHPDDRNRMQETIQNAAKESSPFNIEHRWIRHNGEVIWMKCKGRAYTAESGRAELMTGICMEITEQKENEYTNALLGAIIQGSNDAIISKNLDGVITSWNPGAEHIFGYTEQEAVGQNITMLIPDEYLEEEQVILDKLKRGERINNFETKRQCKDGKLLDVSLTISPVRDSSGKIVGASKIARDITPQKQAERRLREVNNTLEERVQERTKSLLSYQKKLRSLASQLNKAEEQERHRLATELHDNLGQMLALSKMKVDFLQNKIGQSGEIEELKELIDDALKYTRDLMSDLKPPPSLHKEDMKATLQWLADKMEKHNLKVVIDEEEGQEQKQVSEEIHTVLLQSVRELLFNVIKHAGVDTARIHISQAGDQMQLIVEDDGAGFDPSVLKQTSNDGGFGLFNVSERIDLLGGSVQIDSMAGKGTTVKLSVPLNGKKHT